jgi:hypothetical protein
MIPWTQLKNAYWITIILLSTSFVTFLFTSALELGWMYLSYGFSHVPPRHRIYALSAVLAGFPLSFTGIVIGYLTGVSRESAVGALVPAALSLLGLMTVYFIGRDRYKSASAGIAVFAFSANIFIGATLGAASRVEYMNDINILNSKIEEEFSLRMYCKGLGLIESISKPCPLQDSAIPKETK